MAYNAFNPEIESHFLACLVQYGPDVYGEVSLASERDFSPIHKPIFSVIRQQLDANPPGPVTTVILADKLKSYGVDASRLSGVEPYDYMWALSAKPVKKDEAMSLFKELKLLTVRRELVDKCKEAERSLKETPPDQFDKMIGIVDQALSSVNTEYYKGGDTHNIFTGMEAKIEEEGNNPPKDGISDGYYGPFPSFNDVFGPIVYPGSLALVGARSGAGKSSLSWFYTSHVAEKHEIPLLILDAAEMTPEEIQYRAICCLSNGKIPYWALQNREWRKNSEFVRIIRDDIWPRIKKMEKTGIFYHNIGGMSAKEIVSYVKRFYYNKVGRDRMLLINLDYIKGMESFNKNSSEFQAIGNYVMDLKTLITNEIKASIWTSVQNNRSAIMVGKQGADLATENDGQMGLSDRIIQQATHGFIMRYKTPEELAAEGNKFGNLKIVCVKHRRMGRKAYDFLTPVKTPAGKFATNYFNVETKGFAYWDKGTFKEMVEKTGQGVIETAPDGSKQITI
jgi:replicative DNA helicase